MPQGGPLSPLLSNIVLYKLEKELERRGHIFAHYVDEYMIFCKSKKGAERFINEIILQLIQQKRHFDIGKGKEDYIRFQKYMQSIAAYE